MTINVSPSTGTVHGDDASFRSIHKVISDNLKATGLVRTSDTGQINFATVARPATTDTVAGYEILAFSDSQQSSDPVLLKVEYGTGSSIQGPGVWFQVGFVTDGAGNLSGGIPRWKAINGASTATSGYFWASFANNCLTFLSYAATGNTSIGPLSALLVIERLRNVDGSVKTGSESGFSLIRASQGGNIANLVTSRDRSGFSNETPLLCLIPTGPSSFTRSAGSDTIVGVFPHSVIDERGIAYGDMQGVLGYVNQDIAVGATFTADINGTVRTFRALGLGSSASVAVSSMFNGASQAHLARTRTSADNAIAIIWE